MECPKYNITFKYYVKLSLSNYFDVNKVKFIVYFRCLHQVQGVWWVHIELKEHIYMIKWVHIRDWILFTNIFSIDIFYYSFIIDDARRFKLLI